MNIFEYSDEEILKIANPILDTIIHGTNSKDYDLFTTHISESMKTDVNRKVIEEQWANDKLPSNLCLERKLLSVLRKKDCVLILWKARSNDIEDDLLHMLYLQSQDGDVKVIGTWIK